jgi:hypothetical protein
LKILAVIASTFMGTTLEIIEENVANLSGCANLSVHHLHFKM